MRSRYFVQSDNGRSDLLGSPPEAEKIRPTLSEASAGEAESCRDAQNIEISYYRANHIIGSPPPFVSSFFSAFTSAGASFSFFFFLSFPLPSFPKSHSSCSFLSICFTSSAPMEYFLRDALIIRSLYEACGAGSTFKVSAENGSYVSPSIVSLI